MINFFNIYNFYGDDGCGSDDGGFGSDDGDDSFQSNSKNIFRELIYFIIILLLLIILIFF